MLLTRYARIATTQDKAKSYLVRPSAVIWPFLMNQTDILVLPRTSPGPNSIMP
jgi:hypothetical protein